MDEYEDCEEFDEIRKFYSYITQIFCNYLESYIEGKSISLEKIESILNSLVYEYSFFGFSIDERENCYLSLEKCVLEDDDNDETLDIPTPITKTDEWYSNLRNINGLKE